MFFGPKFTNEQLSALAKSIMDWNDKGDAAILRARLLENDELIKDIPLTTEFLPISFFMSRGKKKKVIARHSFDMGVLTGFAFIFADQTKGQEAHIDKMMKQALKRSKVLGYGIDYTSKIYKQYKNAQKTKDTNEHWSKGLIFAKFFLVEFEGVDPSLL